MELLFPALLFAAMYFLLIRPQQRRVRAQRDLVMSLEVGDDVVTVGGVVGRIVAMDDEDATIETLPGIRLRVRRIAISTRANSDDGDLHDGSES